MGLEGTVEGEGPPLLGGGTAKRRLAAGAWPATYDRNWSNASWSSTYCHTSVALPSRT
jgi:hypothetical protein